MEQIKKLFGSTESLGLNTIEKKEGVIQDDLFVGVSQKEGIFFTASKDASGNKIKTPFNQDNLKDVYIVSITNDSFNYKGNDILSTKVKVFNPATQKNHIISFSQGTSKWRNLAVVLASAEDRNAKYTFRLTENKSFVNLELFENGKRLPWAGTLPAPKKVVVNGKPLSDYTEANEICDKIFAQAAKIFTQESLVNNMSEQLMNVNTTTSQPQTNSMEVSVDEVLASFGV